MVRLNDPESCPADCDALPPTRQTAEFVHHQTANRVKGLIIHLNSEIFIEILYPCQCHHLVAIAIQLLNRFDLFRIVLIVYVANNLLQYVFDRQQSGGPAVLIHNDGDVIAADTKFLEQCVQPFAFRNESRRAQRLL